MVARHIVIWFVIAVLAIINGAARDLLYTPLTGELAAHQISTVVLLAIIGAAAWLAEARWPLGSPGEAAWVGALWMIMTVAFECFLGRVLGGKPWEAILDDYNVAAGRIWILIPVWLLIAPVLAFRMRRRTHGAAT